MIKLTVQEKIEKKTSPLWTTRKNIPSLVSTLKNSVTVGTSFCYIT
jgi:nicotinate-nucleotide pyrophosphorylase